MSEDNATTNSSEVETDFAKNKGFLIYFSAMGIAGVAVLVATVMQGWGYWGWMGAGFLLLVGIGGGAGMVKSGGAGNVACPSCGHQHSVLHINDERTLRCEGCHVWLEGSTAMSPCPDDRIASMAAFKTSLPKSFSWPQGCPACGKPCTRTMKVEGSSAVGDAAAMISPLSMQRVIKIDVPCCDLHDDGGVWVTREGSANLIAFRSLAYCRAFETMNTKG